MKKSFFLPAAFVLALISGSCSGNGCDRQQTCDNSCGAQGEIIRLNVFYTLADTADAQKAKEIARKLVAASRNDEGCISYDFLESTTTPGEYMVLETWKNDSLLTLHSQAPHFLEYVPQLKSIGEMNTQLFIIK